MIGKLCSDGIMAAQRASTSTQPSEICVGLLVRMGDSLKELKRLVKLYLQKWIAGFAYIDLNKLSIQGFNARPYLGGGEH